MRDKEVMLLQEHDQVGCVKIYSLNHNDSRPMCSTRSRRFVRRDSSVVLWANVLNIGLFDHIDSLIERCMDGFNAQDLANTAWAFATAR